MPLQQLVEYFNDRLELEHQNGFRPFILQNDTVAGLFGPIRINTTLTPIREALRSSQVTGHVAQLGIAVNHQQPLQGSELDNFLLFPNTQSLNGDSIINFDRLSRTVHMLNYLPQAHLEGLLFVDVDPRHILGIKQDHGAYFEEIIHKCGLETRNVVIGLAVSSAYSRFYPSLLKGLENYQRRGYRVLLKFDCEALEQASNDLVVRAAPEFVGLAAEQFDSIRDSQLLSKIQRFIGQGLSVGSQSILFNIAEKKHAALARQCGFSLVQGSYYEQPVTSVGDRDVNPQTSRAA
jgi:EAL domain-containing protein (putative c-di-GMP-specific phosphodiesterase class I)